MILARKVRLEDVCRAGFDAVEEDRQTL